MLKLVKVIRDKHSNSIIGYSLLDTERNNILNVTKALGIKLGETGYIENAKVYTASNYKNGGKLLQLDNGNISDLESIRINKDTVIGLLSSLDTSLYKTRYVHKPKVLGCIFNELGKIIGLTVQINNQVFNLNSTAARKHIDGANYLSTVKQELFNRYSHTYCATTHMSHNNLVIGFKPFSPDMTPEIANRLYSKNYTLSTNIECDTYLRDLVLRSAREIEYNILKYNIKYNFNLNSCRVVGIVDIYRYNDIKFIAKGRGYIVQTADNKYIFATYSSLYSLHIPNIESLPRVALWEKEIKYKLPYRDEDSISIDEVSLNKINKKLILDAINRRHLTLEQFIRDNTVII